MISTTTIIIIIDDDEDYRRIRKLLVFFVSISCDILSLTLEESYKYNMSVSNTVFFISYTVK